MLRWLTRRKTYSDLPFGVEAVPGIGAKVLTERERWQLAGEYSATHQLTGPWYRRVCVRCGTKRGCEFGRWAGGVINAKARRDWLGQ